MKHLFSIALISFQVNFVSLAQVTAGSGSAGMVINDLTIYLSVAEGQSGFAKIDMDCDAIPEMTLKLSKGNSVLCQANLASLNVHHPALEFCKDTSGNFTGNFGRPHYFNAGDTLICPNNAEWVSDSVYTLGDYGGCITCTGPAKENNAYIAYRFSGQLGWIKISFDLTNPPPGTAPVSLSIDSVLLPCATSSIDKQENERISELHPNPFSGTTVLHTHKELQDATLFLQNNLGCEVKQLYHLSGSFIPIQSNNLPCGIYILRLMEKDRIITTHKLFIVEP